MRAKDHFWMLDESRISFLYLNFFVLCCWVRIKMYLEISLGNWAFQIAYSHGFSMKSFSQRTEGNFPTKYVIMFTDSSQRRMNSPRSHCDLISWPYQRLALTERFSQNSLSAPHGPFLSKQDYLLNVYFFEVWRWIWGLTHTGPTFLLFPSVLIQLVRQPNFWEATKSKQSKRKWVNPRYSMLFAYFIT